MEYQKLLMKLRASCQIKLPNYRNVLMIINTPQNNYDIVIVGGGMVGATFAVTMSETTSKSNLTILVVEATSPFAKDSTESNFDSSIHRAFFWVERDIG